MVKIVQLGDPHGNLEAILATAEHNPDIVVLQGDYLKEHRHLFDDSALSTAYWQVNKADSVESAIEAFYGSINTSYKTLDEALGQLQERGIDVVGVSGNHDIVSSARTQLTNMVHLDSMGSYESNGITFQGTMNTYESAQEDRAHKIMSVLKQDSSYLANVTKSQIKQSFRGYEQQLLLSLKSKTTGESDKTFKDFMQAYQAVDTGVNWKGMDKFKIIASYGWDWFIEHKDEVNEYFASEGSRLSGNADILVTHKSKDGFFGSNDIVKQSQATYQLGGHDHGGHIDGQRISGERVMYDGKQAQKVSGTCFTPGESKMIVHEYNGGIENSYFIGQ